MLQTFVCQRQLISYILIGNPISSTYLVVRHINTVYIIAGFLKLLVVTRPIIEIIMYIFTLEGNNAPINR